MSPFDMSAIPKRGGVYQIRNLRTGEVYIGSSSNLRSRAYAHASGLRNGHDNLALREAARVDGVDGFVFEILTLEESTAVRLAEEHTRIANALLCYNVVVDRWRTELGQLSEAARRNIRAMYAIVSIDGSRTFKRRELAERFGVSKQTIAAIIRDGVTT